MCTTDYVDYILSGVFWLIVFGLWIWTFIKVRYTNKELLTINRKLRQKLSQVEKEMYQEQQGYEPAQSSAPPTSASLGQEVEDIEHNEPLN
jgi:cytoskeletal protein RodZ